MELPPAGLWRRCGARLVDCLLGALVWSVGAMWLLDPDRGRSRRAWLAQKATRAANETGRFMRATGRHLRNKSKGYYYETRSAAECAMSGLTGVSQSQQTPAQTQMREAPTSI